jgi:dienelactone hydrolase
MRGRIGNVRTELCVRGSGLLSVSRVLVLLAFSARHLGFGADAVQLEYAQYQVGEAVGSVSLAVVRGPDAVQAATVDFATTGQTATPDADYTETQGTLVFAPGEKLKLITVPILNDDVKEPPETFQVRLSNATGSSLGALMSTTVTIADNDQGVQFTTRQVWAHEDLEAVILKVLRGSDTVDAFTVDYTFTDITAKLNEDYFATNGTLYFASNETCKTIWVPVVNDQRSEADERFQVQLTNPTGGHVLGSPATVTVSIVDATGMEPARFAGAKRGNDGSVQLALVGPVSPRFRGYRRIFQVEASDDLQAWTLLSLLGSPAASTPPALKLAPGGMLGHRFARLIRSPLFSPDPPPTGPYAVGVTRHDLVDPTRRNRYGISTNGGFPVNIWYPATPVAGHFPGSLLEVELLTVEAAGAAGLMDRLPRFASYSTQDLPLAQPAGSGWPVVLFSHGADAFRLQAQVINQNLASHGFVVVAPDHYDSFAVLLSSGEVYVSSTSSSFTVANSRDRVRDLAVILDELGKMNQDDPLFRSGLDLGRTGAFGFSWGAPTAGELCRTDSRCKAAASLDWGVATTSSFPDLVREGLQKPSLMLNAADNSADYLYSKAMRDAFWIQISNTTHGDFVLAPWLSGGITASAIETARTVQAYVVSFFKKYLREEDDHLLDGQSTAYPRVTTFMKK